MYLPTITIVTPCLNAVGTIDQTIASVVNQAGQFNIHYHIQDGGSTDGTWERVFWWKRHLASTHFIRHCREILFTASQEKDAGLYDAILKGFSHVLVHKNSFMTWINADDLLFPGALAFIADCEVQFTREQVSWITGSTAVVKDSRLISFWTGFRPRKALLNGLCDGKHWEFLQQEGVFFRGWLWSKVAPEKWLTNMKLAGDWNLWRLFAEQCSLIHSNYPIGAFRLREGQLSGSQRSAYLLEIDNILPEAKRRENLANLVESGPLFGYQITSKYPDKNLYIYQEDVTKTAFRHYEKIFGKQPEKSFSGVASSLYANGDLDSLNSKAYKKHAPFDQIFAFKESIVSFDSDWQYPAITEKHAYLSLKKLVGAKSLSSQYFAFPWATMIDHFQCGSIGALDWFRLVHLFKEKLANITPCLHRVTVCQHMKLKQYIHVFKEMGITDIFWSHCTKTDTNNLLYEGIKIHPFPLFPVQQSFFDFNKSKKDLIFSFVGTTPDKYYLTKSRKWIFELCSNKPNCSVIERAAWHYTRVVYDEQVLNRDTSKERTHITDESKNAAEFKDILSRSIFSLCPSGTGPNSIRLWESLGAGAIPVILADTYLPPGPMELWEEAAVFCPETEEAIAALPAKLEAMAKDTALLEKKRNAMKQLWLKYGPDCFVYDILKFMIEVESQVPQGPFPETTRVTGSRDSLVLLAEELVAGRVSKQEVGPLIWRGLFTRSRSSPENLRALLAKHPEIIHAANQTHAFLSVPNRRLARHESLRSLPGLNTLPTLAS